MRYSFLLSASLATYVSAHGVVVSMNGANGVTMPGLTIADGTPRDCSSKYVSYPPRRLVSLTYIP